MKTPLLIVILLTGVLIIGGCSKQQSVSKNELFEIKKECATFLESETKRLTDFTSMENDVNKEGEIGLEKNYSEIIEIFYSEKINSCVSIIKVAYNIDMSYSFRYIVRDILNNTTIGDYYDQNYYDAIISEFGDGEYHFDTEISNPGLCDELNNSLHCEKYKTQIEELKGQ